MSERPEDQGGSPASNPPEATSEVVTNASSNPPSAASSQPAVATEASADVNVPVQPVGEGSVDQGSEPEEADPSPIVAMRAIRIEETKMRSPSAPTIEAGE